MQSTPKHCEYRKGGLDRKILQTVHKTLPSLTPDERQSRYVLLLARKKAHQKKSKETTPMESQVDDSMTMRLSKSQDDDSMLTCLFVI